MRPTPSILDLLCPRLATARDSSQVVGRERVLAWVRVVLAFSSFVEIELNPAEVYPYRLAVRLIVFYLAYACLLVVWLKLNESLPRGADLAAHIVDVIWPTLISLLGSGVSSPFFLYFLFALVGAAFRWGMRETVLTAIAVIAGLAGDAAARSATPLATTFGDPVRTSFVLRSSFALSFAFVIGYLVESERRRSHEVASFLRISAMVRIADGFKASLEKTMQEILKLFSGNKLLLITHESDSGQVVLWRAQRMGAEKVVFSWHTLEDGERDAYLTTVGEDLTGAIWRAGSTLSSMAFCRDRRKSQRLCHLPSTVVEANRFKVLLGCAVSVAPGLSAKVLLVEPRLGGRAETQLRILDDLLREITPPLYNVYLLRRLRSRAVASERGRLSKELHDGTVQSLQAIAFRLYALRTRSNLTVGERERELFELQQLVQNEATSIRHLIHELAPLDFEPQQLLAFVSGMVTRFRQDTGVGAEFICDVSQLDLPPATCREIAGIVREALVNARRHSQAQNVVVQLGHERGACLLVIEDDGRGFEFSGCFTHMEREENRRGPLVIQQRVRALGGELTIISRPGQGARLEIRIPGLARASIA